MFSLAILMVGLCNASLTCMLGLFLLLKAQKMVVTFSTFTDWCFVFSSEMLAKTIKAEMFLSNFVISFFNGHIFEDFTLESCMSRHAEI